MFMVGSLFSLLWCLIVLSLTLVRTTPPATYFPDVDLASKVRGEQQSGSQPSSFSDVLSTLSLANSFKISKEISKTQFYVRMRQTSADLSVLPPDPKPNTVTDRELGDNSMREVL